MNVVSVKREARTCHHISMTNHLALKRTYLGKYCSVISGECRVKAQKGETENLESPQVRQNMPSAKKRQTCDELKKAENP